MKRVIMFSTGVFAACSVFLLAATGGVNAAKGPQPQPYYGEILEKMARVLPGMHLSHQKLDDSVSCKAWTNLITSFDFDHSYFLQEDLDRFAGMELKIDDAVQSGDVSFGYEIYRLFQKRLDERYTFVTNMLAHPISFNEEESYTWKRKNAPWPADPAEQDDLWRRRIKNELLISRLSRELDIANASNKTDKAAAATNATGQTSTTNAPAPTIEENIAAKYKQYKMIIDDLDEESILQRYLGAVAMAYDPHSDYMSPMRKEDFDIDMNLTLCGIGAQLRSEDGAAMIMEIIPGSPAERDKRPCRLVKGDKVIGVGQGDEEIVNTLHWPLNKVVRKIRGKKGTKVVLKVIPASDPSGNSTKRVDLIREEIKLEEQAATGRVERVTLKDGSVRSLGYVRLPTFYGTMDKRYGQPGFRSATVDVAKQIASFNSVNVSGLVLDLRNNGGGSLREAIDLVGLFVRSGPAVQVAERSQLGALPIRNAYSAMAFRKPVVVMINRASASASEIVAAALQDYGRAVIVGDSQSHGKGTVQSVMSLGKPEYGSIKVTTASFFRINGSSTQIKGVRSDIVIPSLLDGLDMMGEDKLPGALPWSKVRAALYMPVGDVQKFVPRLKELSAERLSHNERYIRYTRYTRRVREANERTEVPLEIEARRKLMKHENELRKLEEAEEEQEKKKGDGENDVILGETLNILSDLVDLQGDGDIPLENEGDLRSRMLRIFGIGLEE
ncbi:MAG: carboxy terminal-processing peptidase [Kiritimatiellae bacterium]|nr:carboxy terminal-processing peptidase [Kiritimatiellia bacterium]